MKKLGIAITTLILISTGLMGCSQPESGQPIEPISKDISWQIGETTITGTVTYPDTPGVHPAIVLVAGSGPTDKDWNSPLLPGTNGSARLLADEFAKKGFVTLRYDKRVTGPNAQQNLPLLIGKISLASHLEEVESAVNQLMARSDVNSQRIYAVANSEGTIHAMNYQLEKQPKLAGLLLIAPPGSTMLELVRNQIQAQLVSLPNAREIMEGYDKLMADFMEGKPFTANPSLPDGINNLVKGFSIPVNLPFARELFKVDTTQLLERITSPVLVVIGKKDVQVDWQLDGSRLETAVKNHQNVTFIYPENANHVAKYEPRPREALTAAEALTYNAADRVLDPETLKSMTDWLVKSAGKK